MGVLPFAARPLALLEDRVDRPVSRGEVGDRDELRPVEVVARRLRPRRADEQVPLAELLRQVVEPKLDRAVEMPDRREVLRLGTMSPSAISGTASCSGASIPWAPFSSMP